MKRFAKQATLLGILLVSFHLSALPARAQAIITTYAGGLLPINGTVADTGEGDGGPAISARLFYPVGVAVDGAGNVFIADSSNYRVRKVTPAGIISTFAGNGTSGSNGDGGPAAFAQLNHPASVAVDAAGNVFIGDCAGPIRKVNPAGVITTLAGIGIGGDCGEFFLPAGVAVDAEGNLFVAEPAYHRIRKVTPAGTISTVAGNGAPGFSGDGGPAASAQLDIPSAVTVDKAGNFFIADLGNSRIRKVTVSGIISTVAGNGTWGNNGDGGLAVSAQLSSPTGIAVDSVGDLFIADLENSRIRKVDLSGLISTVTGNGPDGGFSGDGGPAAAAQLSYPGGVALDAAGNLFIADTYNHRIRRVGLSLVPILTGVFPDISAPTATVNIMLTGTNFSSPLIMDAGSGITFSTISVVTDVLATATLTIASDAALGVRGLTVMTGAGTAAAFPFTVVSPFPDLTIASSHVGNLSAGSNGVYDVSIVNSGTAATTDTLTVTDILPSGLSFVSGTGTGWSCAASGQTVTCLDPQSLAVGASTSLTLTVSTGGGAVSQVIHAPKVTVAGDLISSNDSASDATHVATLTPHLQFESTLLAGRQSAVGLTLPVAFPVDVSGTLLLAYTPDTAIPADDPAIQFATGGREVAFTIPANTLEARFGANSQAGPLGFQPGTVAGSLIFSGALQAGEAQSTFSTVQRIPRQAPAIQTVRTDTQNGFAVVITLLSTFREVRELILRFNTTPAVRLGCGAATGCSVSGSTLTFDVKSLFDTWYAGDVALGSLSAIRMPFSIQGTIQGNVGVTLRNSLGTSNLMSFPLP